MVLLVDDNPDIREVYAVGLRNHGLPARVARNAAEALDLISLDRPDVIVLDVFMPGFDGLKLARHLRADPETRSIPIVVLSAASYEAVGEGFRELGISALCEKPLTSQQLAERIRQVLSSAGERRLETSPAPA